VNAAALRAPSQPAASNVVDHAFARWIGWASRLVYAPPLPGAVALVAASTAACSAV
jgi:hypothetical protein